MFVFDPFLLIFMDDWSLFFFITRVVRLHFIFKFRFAFLGRARRAALPVRLSTLRVCSDWHPGVHSVRLVAIETEHWNFGPKEAQMCQ